MDGRDPRSGAALIAGRMWRDSPTRLPFWV
jgi:hypothetical protein